MKERPRCRDLDGSISTHPTAWWAIAMMSARLSRPNQRCNSPARGTATMTYRPADANAVVWARGIYRAGSSGLRVRWCAVRIMACDGTTAFAAINGAPRHLARSKVEVLPAFSARRRSLWIKLHRLPCARKGPEWQFPRKLLRCRHARWADRKSTLRSAGQCPAASCEFTAWTATCFVR